MVLKTDFVIDRSHKRERTQLWLGLGLTLAAVVGMMAFCFWS